MYLTSILLEFTAQWGGGGVGGVGEGNAVGSRWLGEGG